MDTQFLQTEAAILTSDSVADYTPDAWADEVFLDILEEKAAQLEEERSYGEAREFARYIEEALKSATLPAAVKQRLSRIQAKLLIAAFPTLDPDEQASMLRNHLLLAYEMQANLKHKLLFWSKVKADPQTFKDLRLKLIGIVAESSTEIGARKIKDWIADYNRATNNKNSRGRVDQVQFISQNPVTRQLNAEQKQTILFILDFYDWLRDPKLEAGDVPERPELAGREPELRPITPKLGMVPTREQSGPKPIYKAAESSQVRPPIAAPKLPPKTKLPEQNTQPKPVFTAQYKQQLNKLSPEPSEEAKRQMKKLSEEAFYDEPLSISQALINAGLGADIAGSGDSGTRAGKSSVKEALGKQPGYRQTPTKPVSRIAGKQEQSKPAPAGAAVRPEISKDSQAEPQAVKQKFNSLPAAPEEEKLPAPRPNSNPQEALSSLPKEPTAAPGKIIDLKKGSVVELDDISNLQDLAKVTPEALRQAGFEEGLQKIKQKIMEMSGGSSLKDAVNSFQRSPLYNLYISMVVAMMNDSSGDQKSAFERVSRSYEQAGKPYLQRSEFLAIHKLKKELAGVATAAK